MLPFFIEDSEGNIFFAFNKINNLYLCFPKIIKNVKGKSYNEWYTKEINSLRKNYCHLEGLDENIYLVKKEDVCKIYDPLSFVSNKEYHNLDYGLDYLVFDVIKKISNFFEISINDIGIEGSILLGNYNEKSDIDILVYGKTNAKKIQNNFSNFDLVDDIKFFNDLEATQYVVKRIDCGFGNDIDTLKKQFYRRYYGFINNKQFSIVCVPYENNDGYVNLNRKIAFENIYEGYITIKDDDNSCIVPSIYKGIDNKNEEYIIEVYNHYGINQVKQGEKIFIRGKKYKLKENNKNIIIIGFWNNIEERFDLYEKKVFYKHFKEFDQEK